MASHLTKSKFEIISLNSRKHKDMYIRTIFDLIQCMTNQKTCKLGATRKLYNVGSPFFMDTQNYELKKITTA